MFAFAVAWRYAGDREDTQLDAASLHETGAALLGVLRDPLFLAVCALLTLWSFNPVWGSVLYLHMTEGLGFSEQDFGNVTSAFFAGSLIGSIGLLVAGKKALGCPCRWLSAAPMDPETFRPPRCHGFPLDCQPRHLRAHKADEEIACLTQCLC
jgi:hypothetical protein